MTNLKPVFLSFCFGRISWGAVCPAANAKQLKMDCGERSLCRCFLKISTISELTSSSKATFSSCKRLRVKLIIYQHIEDFIFTLDLTSVQPKNNLVRPSSNGGSWSNSLRTFPSHIPRAWALSSSMSVKRQEWTIKTFTAVHLKTNNTCLAERGFSLWF